MSVTSMSSSVLLRVRYATSSCAVSKVASRANTICGFSSLSRAGRLAATSCGTSFSFSNASVLGTASAVLMMGTVASAAAMVEYNTECSAADKYMVEEPVDIGITGGKITAENATGIPFPELVNGMKLIGLGVRIKYHFVKIYAVGTYMDPISTLALKSRTKQEVEQALLNPTYPRVIRIVLHRELTAEQFTSAIIEALEPRMGGQDSWALDDFRNLSDEVTLPKGFEFVMTIRGDTLLFQRPGKGFGKLRSEIFCKALCDVYFGNDPVSPSHKKAVLDGIQKGS